MTDPFTDTRMWCPKCGQLLDNAADGWSGWCSRHGLVAGDFVAPLVVIDDEGVQGLYLRRSNSGLSLIVLSDEGIETGLLAASASIERADNLTREDWR